MTKIRLKRSQGWIHGNSVADGWSGAIKPLAIQQYYFCWAAITNLVLNDHKIWYDIFTGLMVFLWSSVKLWGASLTGFVKNKAGYMAGQSRTVVQKL